jgi:hypothetical protein
MALRADLGLACKAVSRTAEAIGLCEQAVADCEQLLSTTTQTPREYVTTWSLSITEPWCSGAPVL